MRRAVVKVLMSLFVILASVLGATGTAAARHHVPPQAVFTWHVGDDFLNQAVHAPEGDQAMAANGDVVTIEGTGAFTLDDHAASGGGTFKHHMKATGKTITGTFQVLRVKSFKSFGNGVPQGLPPTFFGGTLVLAIALTPDSNPEVRIPALLTVNCHLGHAPKGLEEGIMLRVPGLVDFNKTVVGSGFTVLVKV